MIAYVIGRPASGTVLGGVLTVSANSTFSESDSESGGGVAEIVTVSPVGVGTGGTRVSAAASTRIAMGLLGSGPARAWRRAVPGPLPRVRPVAEVSTMRFVSSGAQ